MAINLEMPKKLQAVIDMAHEGAAEMLRPISRKYDLAEHAYPIELDTLADLFEGISEANTISFAGAEAFRGGDGPQGGTSTAPTCPRCSMRWRSAGATSRCCCRCPSRASATPRSPAWPPMSNSSASARCGPRWRSPSRASVRTRPRCRRRPSSTATSTSSTARRSSSPPARAPATSWCGRRSTRAWAARRSSRSSCLASTPA